MPTPAHPKLSWAGGVLDACGKFALRITEAPGRPVLPYAAEVRAHCAREVSMLLCDALGGGRVDAQGNWKLPPTEQLRVLERLLPYLKVRTQFNAASRVYRFRLTASKGRKLGAGVRAFRHTLAQEAKAARRKPSGEKRLMNP